MRKIIPLLLFVFTIQTVGCEKEKSSDIEEYTAVLKIPAEIYNGVSFDLIIDLMPNDKEAYISEIFLNGEPMQTKSADKVSKKLVLRDINTGNNTLFVQVNFPDGKTIMSSTEAFTFRVREGQWYQGGIVVNTTDNDLHGLIVADRDFCFNGVYEFKYGAYNGDYGAYSMDNGYENTQKFAGKFDAGYAATSILAHNKMGFDIDDWYLPAYNEFVYCEKYLEELNIPERSGYVYWSSTGDKEDVTKAYAYAFGVSFGNPADIQNLYKVRTCRRF